jgi:hypothetical protein
MTGDMSMPKKYRTREELEATEWAKGVRSSRIMSPWLYEMAINYAMRPSFCVSIYHTTETGEDKWAISAVIDNREDTDFWMDAKDTREEAEALCHEMGWEIV